MEELIDARDVLDANARTCRAFQGRTVGHFEPSGPDSWDPYRYVDEPGELHEVLPGLKVQVEPDGALFRMRRNGRVLRVEWQPESGQDVPDEEDRHDLFVRTYLTPFDNPAGCGVQAAIATRLQR